MKRLLAALLFVVGFLFSQQPSHAQVFIVASCGTVPTSQATLTAGNPGMLFIDNTGKLCTAASVSASVTGFTPGLTFATLTATNASASVALPVGATVAIQNTGTTAVSCTLGVGSATAVASEIVVQAASTVFVAPGSNTFGACIDQTGSTSNLVVLAGGAGLGTGFGGGGGSGGGGGAVFGPTAVGSAAANPPVLMAGTANAGATGNVQVAKVDASGTQFIDCSAAGNTLCTLINSPPPLGAATGGWTTKLLNALSTTVTAVKGSAGWVGKLYCYNPNSSVAYIQVFNVVSGSVTLGTTTPAQSYGLGPTAASGFIMPVQGDQYATAISVAATTTATGLTAPSTAVDCNISFN